MDKAATAESPANNVVRPDFKGGGYEVRGGSPERIERLLGTLRTDGRKLRAIEVLMSVRNAQVLSLDVASCSKLVSVASDLDRIMQRVQRAGYRQMDHQLIQASRKVEDALAAAVDALTEQAAVLASAADVDPAVLLDPVVRRRIKELHDAKKGNGERSSPAADGDADGDAQKTKKRAQRA